MIFLFFWTIFNNLRVLTSIVNRVQCVFCLTSIYTVARPSESHKNYFEIMDKNMQCQGLISRKSNDSLWIKRTTQKILNKYKISYLDGDINEKNENDDSQLQIIFFNKQYNQFIVKMDEILPNDPLLVALRCVVRLNSDDLTNELIEKAVHYLEAKDRFVTNHNPSDDSKTIKSFSKKEEKTKKKTKIKRRKKPKLTDDNELFKSLEKRMTKELWVYIQPDIIESAMLQLPECCKFQINVKTMMELTQKMIKKKIHIICTEDGIKLKNVLNLHRNSANYLFQNCDDIFWWKKDELQSQIENWKIRFGATPKCEVINIIVEKLFSICGLKAIVLCADSDQNNRYHVLVPNKNKKKKLKVENCSLSKEEIKAMKAPIDDYYWDNFEAKKNDLIFVQVNDLIHKFDTNNKLVQCENCNLWIEVKHDCIGCKCIIKIYSGQNSKRQRT